MLIAKPPAATCVRAPAISAGLLLPSCLLALVSAAPMTAQIGQNLLTNGDFEGGTSAGWSAVAGTTSVAPYGAADVPGAAVAFAVGGGNLMLRDGGSAVVEQIVTPVIPAGASLRLSGLCGGGQDDDARLVARFLTPAGVQVGLAVTDYATHTQRNGEVVLLYREVTVQVPAAATRIAVRIEFRDFGCCGGPRGCVDNVSAELVVGSTVPAPWPHATELLANAGFEGGWQGTSPLTLLDPRGWEGASGSTVVKAYSNSDPTVPGGLVSCRVDGAAPNPSCLGGASGNLLSHDGGATLRQRIDLRGNTPQFAGGSVALRMSAVLGGIDGEPDTAQVDFRLLAVNGTVLRQGLLAPVTAAERNYERVLLRREEELTVAQGTAFLEVSVTFLDFGCCGGSRGLVDNVSAMLTTPTQTAPVPTNVNLLANDSFEAGSVPGSPLQLLHPRGWRGAGAAVCTVVNYGAPGSPSAAFASANGLGAALIGHGGASHLVQIVDLRGSAATIGAGRLAVTPSAWLGGRGGEPDHAEVRLRFVDAQSVSVGLPVVLPPVTVSERLGATALVQRIGPATVVPATAGFAIVELVFTDFGCCGGAQGLADDIRLVAFDPTLQPTASPYPGTGGDLVVMTGVNGLPRTGPGHYVKTALAGDVLRTVAGSPNGGLDGAPMVLGVNVIPTGVPIVPQLPGLVLDVPSAIGIFNGLGGGAVGPLLIPLSQGGNVWNQLVPPGFQGFSLRIQALALQWNGQVSSNGLFFGSDGHEVRLQ